MTVVDSNAPVVNRGVHAREIFTVDHTYYKGLDEKERLSSVTKKPLKLTKNFTGADAKGCVTLCR